MTDRQPTGPANEASGGGRAHPHRRYDQLLDRWVLVSVGRTRRPWNGSRETTTRIEPPRYDPKCYLCPGNVRANGARNPDYPGTFVFTNDFAALQPDSPVDRQEDGLLVAEGERGTSRVVCFSPRHDLGMASMAVDDIRTVVDMWVDQTTDLGRDFRWVQVFENRGVEMGASSPHPHGQIWAGSAMPTDAAREDATQRAYGDRHARRLLLDYAAQEQGGPRVVEEDADWLVVVPWWAAWPYETLILPLAPASRLADLDTDRRASLAQVLSRLLQRYDSLFQRPFPYSMGWHQAPFVASSTDHWQLHAHVLPPLLRQNVRKFMVGYELLAEPQRDITPEEAAAQLRGAVPGLRATDDAEATPAATPTL
jgi:UDPglucose--hexose-1-phosphate uridylyltransferase